MTFVANERVIVRIDFRNELGHVTRILPRRRVVVLTDSGDCREWAVDEVVKVEGGRQ